MKQLLTGKQMKQADTWSIKEFGMESLILMERAALCAHFSNAEIENFSTASLITRTTNDIQQVQFTCVILLRMVAYAPILGIGGVMHVTQGNTGLAWIIVLDVAVLLLLITVLMSIAMPKFKIMQTLVDKLNLVSREILTGVMPVRAFSRESFEEKRFDAASRELMGTQLFTNRAMVAMTYPWHTQRPTYRHP